MLFHYSMVMAARFPLFGNPYTPACWQPAYNFKTTKSAACPYLVYTSCRVPPLQNMMSSTGVRTIYFLMVISRYCTVPDTKGALHTWLWDKTERFFDIWTNNASAYRSFKTICHVNTIFTCLLPMLADIAHIP